MATTVITIITTSSSNSYTCVKLRATGSAIAMESKSYSDPVTGRICFSRFLVEETEAPPELAESLGHTPSPVQAGPTHAPLLICPHPSATGSYPPASTTPHMLPASKTVARALLAALSRLPPHQSIFQDSSSLSLQWTPPMVSNMPTAAHLPKSARHDIRSFSQPAAQHTLQVKVSGQSLFMSVSPVHQFNSQVGLRFKCYQHYALP